MRKVSLWVLGMFVMLGIASISGRAQTPATTERPALETQQSTQVPAPERRAGGRQRGDRLAKIDANMDGKISREEWPRNPEAFSRLDSNNDGFLTKDEMHHAKGKGMRGHRSFETMDPNNDGQITREEWKGRAEVFDRLDANRDGVVKADEVKSGRGSRRQK